MADQVHVYPRIERQLAQLERQSNAPAVAAQRARAIIDALVSGENPAVCGLMKPRADNRVKNSLKFNLGQGFRLICIKEKTEIFVMFVGDHESSDAWFNHYTRKKPHKTETEMKVFSVEDCAMDDTDDCFLPEDDPDPVPEVSQDMLRRVFRGIAAE